MPTPWPHPPPPEPIIPLDGDHGYQGGSGTAGVRGCASKATSYNLQVASSSSPQHRSDGPLSPALRFSRRGAASVRCPPFLMLPFLHNAVPSLPLVTYGEAVLRGERQSGSRAAADGVRGGVPG